MSPFDNDYQAVSKENYFYSAQYLNKKFDCSRTVNLTKSQICDKIEELTGNETKYITVIDAENDSIEVEYKWYEFGSYEEDTIIINI